MINSHAPTRKNMKFWIFPIVPFVYCYGYFVRMNSITFLGCRASYVAGTAKLPLPPGIGYVCQWKHMPIMGIPFRLVCRTALKQIVPLVGNVASTTFITIPNICSGKETDRGHQLRKGARGQSKVNISNALYPCLPLRGILN